MASEKLKMAVADARRTHTVLRWPAGFAALVIVFAAAGSAPMRATPTKDAALSAQCRKTVQETADQYRYADHISVAVVCARPDGTLVDPKLWLPAAPIPQAPTPVMTAGHAGCVTGPGRPLVGTTLTSVSATTKLGKALIYERQRLDGSDTVDSSGSPSLEFGPGDLAPGGSYRWRARVDDTAEQTSNPGLFRSPDDDQGWSPWCEFTVSADAVDYRGLDDVSLEALNELGLRPDRQYAVTLSDRQQRMLREGTDVGRTSAWMTLTGPRWIDLLIQLTESASDEDETAAEASRGSSPPNGTAYRALVDAISVKLGGPRHPHLD